MHFAHTRADPPSQREALLDHLLRVAEGLDGEGGASQFAEAFGASTWGRLTGLWHDLGKYSTEFQAYLDSTVAGIAGPGVRVDHSTAGAQHAATRFPGLTGRVLAYCIAGHHTGLPDLVDSTGGTSGLAHRLLKAVPNYSAAPQWLIDQSRPARLGLAYSPANCAFQVSIFCRMLYSCLVDADYLATESFMRPERAEERSRVLPSLTELLTRLDGHLARLATSASPSIVNRARATVLAQCREKAELSPGLFSLTVPTGGGKTLSTLAFALGHAARHGLRRVLYAIPFTSIIEQNASVFREALETASEDVVLEHHSNFDPAENRGVEPDLEVSTPWHRLAAENWDAPVVVTTNVQLFESLFANKPSRCRKLHRIARSVIILDECQTLPVTLLQPTLSILDELCRNYGCTVVLCSATQPAIQARDGFGIGLTGVREIIDAPDVLYECLRRVEVSRLGKLDDEAVVARLCQHEQVLCVVNTRVHAGRLFTALRAASSATDGVFHLSAQMCPAHRTAVLDDVRTRLDVRDPKPCRVISTQLIEAGVDVDFPVVYRAMAGLDSIAQAAGRCNREGRRERGKVFVFDTDAKPTHDVKCAAQHAAEVGRESDNLLSLRAIDKYFLLNYWSRCGEWDKHGIMDCFAMSGDDACFQFREAAELYRLIPDAQQPVIVPYGKRGREMVATLRQAPTPPGRRFDRQVQRYSVGLPASQFDRLSKSDVICQYHERYWVVESEAAYDGSLGLQLDQFGFSPELLCQ